MVNNQEKIKKIMDEDQRNLQIEKIANLMIEDKLSIDEQDQKILNKYREKLISEFNLDSDEALKIVYEALLYLKLKSSEGTDPIQKGDQFGAGFS